MTTAALPWICASGLTRAHAQGRACAVPNCKRRFRLSRSSSPRVIGITTGGRPVRACADHDPALVLGAVSLIPGSLPDPLTRKPRGPPAGTFPDPRTALETAGRCDRVEIWKHAEGSGMNHALADALIAAAVTVGCFAIGGGVPWLIGRAAQHMAGRCH